MWRFHGIALKCELVNRRVNMGRPSVLCIAPYVSPANGIIQLTEHKFRFQNIEAMDRVVHFRFHFRFRVEHAINWSPCRAMSIFAKDHSCAWSAIINMNWMRNLGSHRS